jgi:hypothetical protein
MARTSLPSNYTNTLAATSLERLPQCKVEIEWGGSYHDVSADVISVSVTHTMEARAGSAQIALANALRLYSRLWSDQADPPASEGHRVRVWMTNSPADFIQVFQGYIVSGGSTVKRGDAETVTLDCMDAGRKAWLGEITMEPVLGRSEPTSGVIRVRRNQAQRQVNALVTNILKHEKVGFADADISLAALDYVVFDWAPGTFNPMSDIAQLLGTRHHFLWFDWEGKAVSRPIIPSGPASWTYGAFGAYPLHVSFEERWQEPERMASVVNVTGHQLAAVPELALTATKIFEDDYYFNNSDPEVGPIHSAIFKWNEHDWAEEYRFGPTDPLPTAYGGHYIVTPAGHLEDVNLVEYAGMAEAPYDQYGLIRIYWQGSVAYDDWVRVQVWGYLRQSAEGNYRGTATNADLDAAGYKGVVEEQNDYLGGTPGNENADCEWLAKRLATWLANECHPATLVVPCNLVHEPGDLITVNLDKYGGAAARAVDYIVVTHKIDYKRGKPNLSTLELVRDTAHMWD